MDDQLVILLSRARESPGPVRRAGGAERRLDDAEGPESRRMSDQGLERDRTPHRASVDRRGHGRRQDRRLSPCGRDELVRDPFAVLALRDRRVGQLADVGRERAEHGDPGERPAPQARVHLGEAFVGPVFPLARSFDGGRAEPLVRCAQPVEIQERADAERRIPRLTQPVQGDEQANLLPLAKVLRNEEIRAARVLARHLQLAHVERLVGARVELRARGRDRGTEPEPSAQQRATVPRGRAHRPEVYAPTEERGALFLQDSCYRTPSKLMESGTKGPPLRIEQLTAYLEDQLAHEQQVLDLLVVAQARGQQNAELWDKLHAAALRDDRLVELASAYEKLAQDRRVKIMPPQHQAQVFLNASRFFMRALGDVDAAESSLERVLGLVPGHPEAFELLKRILDDKGDREKLATLYLTSVGPRTEKDVALANLRAALGLLPENDAERAVKIAQQILRLDPGDEGALGALDTRLSAAGKFPELARALEQALASDPPMPDEKRLPVHARLVELYDGHLPEVERAMPHVEVLLAADTTNEIARRVATRLVTNRSMAARAAAALEKVFEDEGDPSGIAQMLSVQIEQLRGPKRAELQKRLAFILLDLADEAAAYTNLEAVMAVDPSDDDVRERYVELAQRLGKQSDASKMLSRAAAAVKDPASRARVNLQTGRLIADVGDLKRARVILQGVFDQAEGATALEAARSLRDIVEGAGDVKALAPVLEGIARLTEDPDEKLGVLRRLSGIYEGELKDLAGAISARKRALELDPTAEPEELERLLEARGDYQTLADVLEIRAGAMPIDDTRREMLLRAAVMRAQQANDTDGATTTLLRVVREHGPARDIHAELFGLLEQSGRTEELAEVLAADIELASEEERPELLSRLGRALVEIGRQAEALEAFAEVLSGIPDEPNARATVLEILEHGDAERRLRASEIIGPLQRADGDLPALVRTLEIRAELHADPAERLAALAEAFEHVDAVGKDRIKALFLAGRGLREAVAHDVESVPDWLDRISSRAERGPSKAAIAETLASALRDRAIDHPAIARLAQRTGEAYAAAGDINKALDALRRVLEIEPDNAEVLERIDHLLAEKGAPEERVALYRASLARPTSPERRRELWLSIAAVEANDIADLAAAEATIRAALEESPGAPDLRAALADVLGRAGRDAELYDHWSEDHANAADGSAEQAELSLLIAGTAEKLGRGRDAARHYLLALRGDAASITPERLAQIERLATDEVDVPLLCAVAERRVGSAAEGVESIEALERLGALLGERAGDPARAAECFFSAAQAAEDAGDLDRAVADLERVLAFAPEARQALERLVEIHRTRADAARLLDVTRRLVAAIDDPREITDLLSTVIPLASDHLGEVLAIVDAAVARSGASLDLARARAAAFDAAGRVTDAAEALRNEIERAPEDLEAEETLACFLAEKLDVPELLGMDRWLLDRRVARSEGADLVDALLALATFERSRARDAAAAARVLDRVLEISPDEGRALAVRYEIATDAGDFAAAARCLRAWRDVETDPARRLESSLKLAELSAGELNDAPAAIELVEELVDVAPSEPRLRAVALGLLPNAELAERAAQALERVASSTEDLIERGRVYDSILSSSALSPSATGVLAERRADLFEAWIACLEGEPARALEVVSRAAREVPENESFWDRAEELAKDLRQPGPVAAAYLSALGEAKRLPEEVALQIGERGVAFQEEWFDDQEAVTGMLRLLVDVVPSAAWAFERLKLVYNAGERWDELFALYDHVIAAQPDPSERALVLEDAAEIARDLAGDAERSMQYLEALLALKPSERLESQLERLYEKHNKHDSLVGLLEARIPRLDAEDARATRLRAAGLWDGELSDLVRALAVVRPLVEAGDDEAEALVAGWLERTRFDADSESPAWRRLTTPSKGSHGELRTQIAELLSAQYRARKDDARSAAMVEVLLEPEIPTDDRKAKLASLSKLRAALGDEPAALQAEVALVALASTEKEEAAALKRAEKVAGQDKAQVTRLVDALLALGEEGKEADRSLRLLRRASELARGVLEDEGKAIGIDLAILSRSDQDKEGARDAARQLDRTLAANGREAERCQVLERLASLETEPAARRAALVEAARIAEEVIGDRQRAIRSLGVWLEEDPKDLEVLTKLVDNLRATGDTRALVAALESRAKVVKATEDAQSDHLEIARVLARFAGDAAGAIEAYRRVIELYGATDEIVDELAEQYDAERRVDDAAALFKSEVARTKDITRRAELYARLGDAERRRGEVEASLRALLASLELSPTGRDAQAGLERLLGVLSPADPEKRSTFARGVEALAKSFEAARLDDRWLALVPARLAASDEPVHKCQVLLAAAEMEESTHGGDVRALERTVQAFGIRPEHEGVAQALLTRARATGRWDLVAPGLLPALAMREDIPAPIARDLLVLGATWASGGGTVPTAAPQNSRGLVEGLLAAALRIAPRDEEVLERLVVARRATPGMPLVEVLQTLSDVRGGELDTLHEAAAVAMRDVGDSTVALPIGERLLSLASERLRGGDASAAEEVLWALELVNEIREAGADMLAVKTNLLAAADLPLPDPTTWELLSRAADLAEPAEAAAILERLYAREPANTTIADRLVALYKDLGQRDRLAATYGRMASVSEDPGERANLRLAQADLLEETGDQGGAIAVLNQTLADVSAHGPTVERLSRLLGATGQHAEHASLHEQQGEFYATLDPSLAADHLGAASRIAETELRDPARAARTAKRVVDLAPSAAALDRLASLLERAGKHQDEAAVLERLASMRGDDDDLSLRIATAYGRAGQNERAREGLERALVEGRASEKVRDVLAELYRSSAAWVELAQLLAREAELTDSDDKRLEKLREAASIYTNQLESPREAIPLLERAVELKPDELATLFALSEAMRGAGLLEEAKGVLERILAEFGKRKPKERALVHFELGRLYLATNDKTQALVELEAASKIDPANADVLQLLGEIAANEGQYLRAQRTYRALLLVLRSHRGGAAGAERAGADRRVTKAKVLVELAYLAEKQKEADRKEEFVESAFEAVQQDPSEHASLVAALSHRGMSDLVARAFEQRLASEDVPAAERTSVELELAELYKTKLEKPEAALAAALRALGRAPLDPKVVERSMAIAKATGGTEALLGVLQAQAREADSPRGRLDLWLRAAELAERELGDDLAALAAYDEALACTSDLEEPDPARRATVLIALERLSERLVATNRAPVSRHIQALQGLIDLADEEQAGFGAVAQPFYRLIGLQLGEGEEDVACTLLERASRDDADGDRFEGFMRDVIGRFPEGARLPRLLEDVSRERGRWAAVIFALETIADRSDDPAPHLRDAYEVSERLEDSELSERLLRRIVPSSNVGDSEEVAWALTALAERRFAAGDAHEAADLWERAARVSEPDEQRALLLRVADIAARLLASPKRAIALYEELRAREPADRDLWAPLVELHRAQGDTKALADLIDQTIPLVDDMHERAGLRFSLATMLESSDPARAADVLSEAIEEDPTHQDAAALLVRLYEATGRSDQLVTLLERQLDVAKDASDKDRVVAIGLRVASLKEQAGDEDAALEGFHGVLDWDEKNITALRAVMRIAERREDSLVQSDLLDRLLEVETGEEAGNAALRLADLKQAAGDWEGVERALLVGLKANEASPQLRQRLGALYAEREDKVGLARLSAMEARVVPDPELRKQLLVKAGESLRDEGAMKDAADAFESALEVDPLDRDILFSFMDACANTAQHARAIAAVDRAIDHDPADDDAWLYFSRAVLREAVGDSDLALDDLEQAFDQSGGGYHAELRAHLEAALVRVARDPSASRRSELEIRLRLAEVAAQSGDPDSARVVVDEVLRRDPRSVVALLTLARIEERSGRLAEAADVYAHVAGIAEGAELTSCALRLQDLARRIGRPEVARGALERAAGASPGDTKLRAALRSVYEDSGAIGELADMLIEEARANDDESARYDTLLEAARLLLYGTGDASLGPAMAERSIAVLEEAAPMRPDDPDVILLLCDAFGAAGRIDDARARLAQVIGGYRGKRSKELGQAYYTLYRVEARDGNLTEAMAALSKAFDNQPQNGGIALELGQLALDLDDQDVAQRAFRAVTLMKVDGSSGVTTQDRALAYFQLGSLAVRQGDNRRAKLMLDKSLAEDPSLAEARELLARL